jgi:hypothetical protein
MCWYSLSSCVGISSYSGGIGETSLSSLSITPPCVGVASNSLIYLSLLLALSIAK